MAVCAFAATTVLADPIEIVPARGSTISTNINQREPAKKDFGAMVPGPTHPFYQDDSWQGTMPAMMPPPETRTLTPREKELLDRRRNWVFMTPEELMSGESTEEMLGIKEYNKDGSEKEPMTVMERYYQHLIEPSRNVVTNRFGKDSDSWNTAATNSTIGEEQNGDNAHRFESPFNSSPAHEIFRPMRPNSFSDAFGTSSDSTTPDPETMEAEREQKAHMESFKQLWDIDQPSAPATVSIPESSSSGSGSSSFPSMQPVLGTFSSSVSSSSGRFSGSSTQPTSAPAHTPPPRPNFTMPQRQF